MCFCGARGAPDSCDNLLVFVVCVGAAWRIGDTVVYYLEKESSLKNQWANWEPLIDLAGSRGK